MTKKVKTNALRMLDRAKINYEIKEYQYDEDHLSGEHIIDQVDMDAKDIFKTLVLKGNNGYLVCCIPVLEQIVVCCIPVLEQIDLKKLAKLSNNKSVEMIHMKDLLGVTGYIRGGCSPVGMKKKFPTFFDSSIDQCQNVALSAGKCGYQMIVNAKELLNYLDAQVGDVIRR